MKPIDMNDDSAPGAAAGAACAYALEIRNIDVLRKLRAPGRDRPDKRAIIAAGYAPKRLEASPAILTETLAKRGEAPGSDGLARLPHQVEVEVQVVDRVEPRP